MCTYLAYRWKAWDFIGTEDFADFHGSQLRRQHISDAFMNTAALFEPCLPQRQHFMFFACSFSIKFASNDVDILYGIRKGPSCTGGRCGLLFCVAIALVGHFYSISSRSRH
eukprot:TRINITY_DN35776_c0_g1_i1.p1 TRINITY_DN35776_c0_g1~~TRINITY_DN35776_c0_g1_i1.p1  ORF type:complete len:111 (-),score=4.42 TRINITY_DN35776_c0_g1_i1:7-339(-)